MVSEIGSVSPRELAKVPGKDLGGEAGIRTLRPRLSNVVMARDFWF